MAKRLKIWVVALVCCFVMGVLVAMSGNAGTSAVQLQEVAASSQGEDTSDEDRNILPVDEASATLAESETVVQGSRTPNARTQNAQVQDARANEPESVQTASSGEDDGASPEVPVADETEGAAMQVDQPGEPQLFSLPAGAEFVPNVVLVSVNKGMDSQRLAALLAEEGVRSVDTNSVLWITDDLVELGVAQGFSIEEAVNELLGAHVVQDAQPDYLYEVTADELAEDGLAEYKVPNEGSDSLLAILEEGTPNDLVAQTDETQPVDDPYFSWQWALASMNVPQAWEQLGASPHTVGVAMLDAGVDVNHEDLRNVIPEGAPYNAYRASMGVTDAEELADVAAGPSVINHGTHVAGIIAAESNNGVGIAGVANNVQLIPIRCYSYDAARPSASTKSLVAGYAYAIENQDEYNIRVINFSMGAKVNALPDNSLLRKIDEAFSHGIVTVASAGNLSSSSASPFVNYPGDYETCVSVINLENNTLTTRYGTESGGAQGLLEVLFGDAWDVSRYQTSNYNAVGQKSKDISAPGTQILSSIDEGTTIRGETVPYMLDTGTSMAAPQVSGVLALMHGFVDVPKDAVGAQYMVDVLYGSARALAEASDGFDESTGFGEVDALEALNAIGGERLVGPSYVRVGQEVTYSVLEAQGDVASGWTFFSSSPDILSIDAETGVCIPLSVGSAAVRATDGTRLVPLIKSVVVVGDVEGYGVVTVQGTTTYAVQQPTVLDWEWESSDAAVASISASGVLTVGDAAGRVTLTATLAVTKGTPDELSISKDVVVVGSSGGAVAVQARKTETLVVEGPEGWAFAPEDFVWSSEDELVAKVDAQGVVTGVCGGSTTVWAFPREACTTYVGDDGREHVSSELYLSFSIVVRDKIDRAGVRVTNLGTQTYTGKALTPVPVLYVGTRTLRKGVDFVLSYASNVNAGTAKVTIAGVGAFEGSSRTESFKIVRASISSGVVASIANKAYTGKAIEPKPKVRWSGSILKLGRDYTLSYKNNVKAGVATVVVAGKGNFKGTKKATFSIVAPSVTYRAHVQTYGWRDWARDGKSSVLAGKDSRVEAVRIKLASIPCSGGVTYCAYVQGIGWQSWKSNGEVAGTTGKSKRVEAIRIKLTGQMAKHYSVCYRTKVQGMGWMPWAKDGKTSGTMGRSLRIYEFQIKVVPK